MADQTLDLLICRSGGMPLPKGSSSMHGSARTWVRSGSPIGDNLALMWDPLAGVETPPAVEPLH
jgi:hypothetical protein